MNFMKKYTQKGTKNRGFYVKFEKNVTIYSHVGNATEKSDEINKHSHQ